MRYAIGLDIGGTKIHSVVVEWKKSLLKTREKPNIIKSKRFPIQNKEDRKQFFAELTQEIDTILDEFGKKNLSRIGIGIAGPLTKNKFLLDTGSGLNLPLENFPIRTRLISKFSVPVLVNNDTNCFTWAEHLFGAAHSSSSTIGITLGTAVGGGFVFDIKGAPMIWEGFHGSAGEIGYMILGESASSFTQLCSSQASYLWRNQDPSGAAAKAEAGDVEAKEAYRRFGFWLGVAVSNLINIINPETVVIGGSIAKSSNLFEKDMQKGVEEHVSFPQAKKTKITFSKLGDEGGALGAAYLPK